MCKIEQVRPLIWELTELDLPPIPPQDQWRTAGLFTEGEISNAPLRKIYHFPVLKESWGIISDKVLHLIRNLDLNELWQGYNANLKPFDTIGLCIHKDLPNFNMHSHHDNRRVIGAIIVNLVDNKDPTTFLNYTSPTERNTGIFFLNDYTTRHAVRNTSDRDRITAYQNIFIDSFFRGTSNA